MRFLILIATLIFATPAFADFRIAGTTSQGAISDYTCTTDNAIVLNNGTGGTSQDCDSGLTYDGTTLQINEDFANGNDAFAIDDNGVDSLQFTPTLNAQFKSVLEFFDASGTSQGALEVDATNDYFEVASTGSAAGGLNLRSGAGPVRLEPVTSVIVDKNFAAGDYMFQIQDATVRIFDFDNFSAGSVSAFNMNWTNGSPVVTQGVNASGGYLTVASGNAYALTITSGNYTHTTSAGNQTFTVSGAGNDFTATAADDIILEATDDLSLGSASVGDEVNILGQDPVLHFHATTTLAQVNADVTILAGVTGRIIRVVDFAARVSGTWTTCTTVDLQDTNGTPVIIQSAVAAAVLDGAVLKDGTTNVTRGAGMWGDLTTGEGIEVVNTGSDCAGGTSITWDIQYTID